MRSATASRRPRAFFDFIPFLQAATPTGVGWHGTLYSLIVYIRRRHGSVGQCSANIRFAPTTQNPGGSIGLVWHATLPSRVLSPACHARATSLRQSSTFPGDLCMLTPHHLVGRPETGFHALKVHCLRPLHLVEDVSIHTLPSQACRTRKLLVDVCTGYILTVGA